MILEQLLSTVTWGEVKEALTRLYPSQEDHITEYEEVFTRLIMSHPAINDDDITIIINFEPAEGEDGIDSWDVYGKKPDSNLSYALEFTPRDEWLGFNVDEESLSKMPAAEFVAHCMWEMTFCGFDEAEVEEFLDDLHEKLEETESSPKDQYVTWDELRKELEDIINEGDE